MNVLMVYVVSLLMSMIECMNVILSGFLVCFIPSSLTQDQMVSVILMASWVRPSLVLD
jgi:hypothetical protein